MEKARAGYFSSGMAVSIEPQFWQIKYHTFVE